MTAKWSQERILALTILCLTSLIVADETNGSKCRDRFKIACRQFKRDGICGRRPIQMRKNCRKSCGFCLRSNIVQRQPPLHLDTPVRRQQLHSDSIFVKNYNREDVCTSLLRPGGATRSRLLTEKGLVKSSEDVSFRDPMSLERARNITNRFHCTPAMDTAHLDCERNMCYHNRFRTMDGTCNNFRHPGWGAAFSPLKRLRPPVYDDGISAPVGSLKRDLPSAREASRLLLRTESPPNDTHFNSLLMQWGQFLSHDISETTKLPNDTCKKCGPLAKGPCMSIPVSKKDPNRKKFGCSNGRCCIRTFRSSPLCGTGESNPRQQFNEHTAFIDAGMVYGNSVDDLRKLTRGDTGMLRSSIFRKHHFLPFDRTNCASRGRCKVKFKAGDDRVNIFLGLIAVHTYFLREHNRIARRLRKLNRHWDGERILQETRKIVGATVQVITYKEYLPRVLGKSYDDLIENYKGYRPKVDPSVSNAFATAAFRFGHGQLTQRFERIKKTGRRISGFDFADGVRRPDRVLFEGGVDPIIIGLCMTKSKPVDSMASQVTDKLFGNSDLASLNIQRGREHGLPGYNVWRQICGLKRARNMDDLKGEITNKKARNRLKRLYRHPDKIDLFVGQMLEDPVPGGIVGPTVACIIADQFKRIRDGDRFWYENSGVFGKRQRRSLQHITLSRLLCDNGDNIKRVPRDAFKYMSPSRFVACNKIPKLNLNLWKER